MCDTQKVKVPPSLNAMEGTGREVTEREAAGGRQGKEGKSRKGNKVEGLEGSQFSSFHRACVSSVGCSNAGGKLGAPENMQRCACHAKVSCERKAVHQMRCGTKRGRLRDLAQGRDRRDCGGEAHESFRSPPARCVHRLNSDYSSRAAKGLHTCCAGRMIVDTRSVYVV